jgi:2-polyprenyl-3-methyl-5-hydroxy-6-metoxy-1,4-benzoquinol methylase
VYDPVAFRSDQLPTEHFDKRFSDENLGFWVPLLVEAARISRGVEVLDVGCGTGGFSRSIASSTFARVTGYDSSDRFIEHARRLPALDAGAVDWVVGDAEQLPFASASFDRVLLSLVLHQLPRPFAAVAEAFRVLRGGGLVLVRTIAPQDVFDRVPERYLPAMAEADAARLPPIETIEALLRQAGFTSVKTERRLRNKRLTLAEEERALLVEARFRYTFLTTDQLCEGLQLLRAAAAETQGDWVDPRPTYIIVAAKPRDAAS